uniref:Terpene synthase metal-binding domain-containing protein n=1 Tax=Kalanchoe fedtschenkoi TaxID=63787 RepID=A0A7N0V1R2_KALFE
MAKQFIGDISSKAKKWECDTKHLAMLDYEIVQSQHKMEAQQFFTWWNNTGLAKEMKLARDQPMKWYIHSAVASDPSHSQLRVNLAKIVSLVYIIDDIFDVYGSLDNLIVFTEAVKRWDYAEAEQLPHYMKSCLRVLFDTTEEFANEIHQAHGFNPISYLQKVWANLFDAFLVEAKWFASKHLPLSDEYLKNGTVSTGMHVFLLHLLFMSGEKANITAEFLTENSRGMVNSAAAMLRLLDDLDSATDETQVGKD